MHHDPFDDVHFRSFRPTYICLALFSCRSQSRFFLSYLLLPLLCHNWVLTCWCEHVSLNDDLSCVVPSASSHSHVLSVVVSESISLNNCKCKIMLIPTHSYFLLTSFMVWIKLFVLHFKPSGLINHMQAPDSIATLHDDLNRSRKQ